MGLCLGFQLVLKGEYQLNTSLARHGDWLKTRFNRAKPAVKFSSSEVNFSFSMNVATALWNHKLALFCTQQNDYGKICSDEEEHSSLQRARKELHWKIEALI